MKLNYYFLILIQLLLISGCSTLTEPVDDSFAPETYQETYEPMKSNSERFISTQRNSATTRIRQPKFHDESQQDDVPSIDTKTSKQKPVPKQTRQVKSSQNEEESILKRKPFTEEIFPITFTKPKQKIPSDIKQPQIKPSPFSTPYQNITVNKPRRENKDLVKFRSQKIKPKPIKLKKRKPVKSYQRLVKRNKNSIKPYKRLIKRKKKLVKPITRDRYEQPQSSIINSTPQRNLTEILSNYRLGKSDLIDIKVFGEENLSMKVRLSEEGIISYPFLGELDLADLTVNEVEKLITSGLKGDYLVDPKVTVAILEYRQFFVNGEIKNSGGYDFVPGMTINKAISLAGGFTERASRNEIFIIRDGDETATPLPAQLDTYIAPGDIINIKQYQKFFVDGEVKKAGSYNFLHGLTVNKAISMAGGFTEKASRNEIFIIPKNKEKIAANLSTPVKPGDIIMVKQYKKFFVDGEVKNPGGYEYLNGITVKKAISMAGGFTEKADSETILLVYQQEPNTQYLVDMNMNVEPGDIITIKEYQQIFVGGEVKQSGGYNYINGLTVDNAISMAGGFTEKADRETILLSYQGEEQKQYLVDLNMKLEPGDIITIKAYEKFFVDGEVKNPGGYNYIRDLTVKRAISMAGGFTQKADRESIFIDYQGNENAQSLVSLYEDVKPGDIITIKPYQKIFVDGEVKNPAAYDYLPDLTVKTAISMAGGFTEKADRKAIFIAHQGEEDTPYLVDLYAPVTPGDVITIKEYQQFFVDGEVKNPGSYGYLRNLTVKTAISMAGGFTENSSREEIYIIHQGEEQTKVPANLYTQVKPGDIITVQEYQKFFVDGEVAKPGDYTYLPGLTIQTAISMAGGFTEKAARGQIFIAHHGNEQGQRLANIFSAVKPGDVITVKKYNKFFVNGEVKNAGGYDFIPGLTVEKAISMAGGFTEYGSASWSKIYILPENDKTGKPQRVKMSTPVYPGDIITVKESLF
jgi:protein involved in polysaccharide export with SLBB domain